MRKEHGKIGSMSEEFWFHVSQQHELPLAANQTADQEIGKITAIAAAKKTNNFHDITIQNAGDLNAKPR